MLERHNDVSRIKLVDFGLAADPDEDPMTAVCGTPQYVAPELLRGVMGHRYGPECDIWSAGVLLFNLLAGYPPFHSNCIKNLLHKVANGAIDFHDPVWELISPSAIDLVLKLLTVDPQQRITLAEALQHPWLCEQ